MNNKKNNKGFTLVLSLVLLLAMSLMGGALIVIASSDHQGNNSSDEYQQTFYIAETALMQAEKSIIDKMMGPVDASGNRSDDRRVPINLALKDDEDKMISGNNPDKTPCYLSFKNLSRDDSFRYVEHVKNKSFLELMRPIVSAGTDEEKKLSKYKYEFFSVNSGSSTYKAAGSSLKKTSSTIQRKGTTYRIYGCGIKGDPSNPEILIPLETILILSN